MDAAEARRLLSRAHAQSSALAAELADARREIEHLETALRTNRQIAIALGILMARHRLSDDAAFDMLRTISQRSHRPIRQLAEEIVYTGDLPADVAG